MYKILHWVYKNAPVPNTSQGGGAKSVDLEGSLISALMMLLKYLRKGMSMST